MLRRLGFVVALAVLPLVIAAPRSASAQSDSEVAMAQLAEEEARALFNAGLAAYEAGRFEDALWSFQRAYDRSSRPELLYNVGQCHDRLRQDALAIESFRRYLELLPAASNRHQVEARLRVLEASVARQNAVPTPAEVAANATQPAENDAAGGLDSSGHSHRGRRIALITTASVVVVVAAVVVTILVTGSGSAYSDSEVGTVFALHGGAR